MSVSTENNSVGEAAHADASPKQSLPRLGEVLREKREAMQLTTEDVSNRLRLSVRQIQALEDNKFSAFPEPMMTRGFLRNYARLLELDAETLLSAYRIHVPTIAPHSISIPSANVQLPNGGHPSWGKYWLLLGFFLLLAVAYFAYVEYQSWQKPAATVDIGASMAAPQESTTESAAEAGVAANQAMPQAALPLAERQQEEGVTQAEPSTGEAVMKPDIPLNNPVTAKTQPLDVSNTTAQPVVNGSQAPLAEQPGSAPVVKVKQASSMPMLKLQFMFAEASWVSVLDRDGKQLIHKTASADSREELQAYPPLKIVLGNASASQLIFQGKAIDLSPYTKLNVARLTLDLE